MKFFTTFFILFCTLKSIFYAKYELKNNNNKLGSLAIAILSISGLIINTYLIYK